MSLTPEEINKITTDLGNEYPQLDFSFQDGYFEELMLIIAKAQLAKNQPDREKKPKVVTLCGSTRFVEYFNEYRMKLTLQGEIVLGIELVVPQTHQQDPQHSDYETKIMLDELHKRKIDISDYILVLNVGGYIGDSTRGEIEYAESTGKPVVYLEALTEVK